jgi:hypothetical protein
MIENIEKVIKIFGKCLLYLIASPIIFLVFPGIVMSWVGDNLEAPTIIVAFAASFVEMAWLLYLIYRLVSFIQLTLS